MAIESLMLYAARAYVLQFALLCALYGWGVFRLSRRLGLLDARVLFFASAAVYSTSGSIDHYLFQDIGAFGEATNASILAIGSLFMIPAGILLISVARETRHAPGPVVRAYWLPVLGAISIVLLAGYVALSLDRFGQMSGQLTRATLVSQQGTVASVGRSVLVAFLLTWTWVTVQFPRCVSSKLVLTVVVLALVGFDLFFLGDRRIVVGMLLGLLYLTMNRSTLLPNLLPVLGIAALGLVAFAALRELPTSMWFQVLSELELSTYLSPVNLDFGGFPLIASDVLHSPTSLVADAPSYIDGILAAIPSSLFPDRPASFSLWYVRTFHPEVAVLGGGFASNWIIESYLSTGFAGCIFGGLITAGVLNKTCSLKGPYASLGCAASIPAFTFLMRLDFTSFLQVFGLITILAIALGRLAARRTAVPPIAPDQESNTKGNWAT